MRTRWLLVAAAYMCLCPAPRVAWANETGPSEEEIAAARWLFTEGKELEKKGDYAAALEKFQTVGQVKMTPQVRFHIALCQENLGKLVAAINGFELAAAEAKVAGASAVEVVENAPSRAEAIRKRVPRVRIHSSARVTVLLDRSQVIPVLMGTEIPIDPGTHSVDAELSHQNLFHQEFSVELRQLQDIDVKVDTRALQAANQVPALHAPARTRDRQRELPNAFARHGSRLPAYIAGGVGAAGLVGSAVFFGLSRSAASDVRATCNDVDHNCDPQMRRTAQQGQTFATTSAVFGGIGLVGIAAAGVLWFTAPHPTSRPVSLTFAPTFGGGALTGTF